MELLSSFQVDHLKLKAGLFVARKDIIGINILTTFDLRLKRPYAEEVMETGSIHALQHICESYLRNDPLWGSRIIHFAPMACRTGFCLIIVGDLFSEDILPLVERTFDFASEFEGEIPGATPKECGYCVDMDLALAKVDAALYYNILIDPKKENLNYPIKRARKKKEA